jgi:hypothetical protein
MTMENYLKILCTLLVMSVPVAPSPAQEVDYQPVFESLFSHMAITYICRDALGGLSHYQAARTIAIGTISPLLGEGEAILRVDEMDQRFRTDPRAANPDVSQQACIESTNETLHRINVEKAKAGLVN